MQTTNNGMYLIIVLLYLLFIADVDGDDILELVLLMIVMNEMDCCYSLYDFVDIIMMWLCEGGECLNVTKSFSQP